MNTVRPAGVSIHPAAINECPNVGSGTTVAALAHLSPAARVGTDCTIGEHVFIGNDVVVGDRVTIKCGVLLSDGTTLENDVMVGPNVTFAGGSAASGATVRTMVRRSASVGAHAAILPGLQLGTGSVVEAGAVVTRDVPPHAIVGGHPAVIKSYAHSATGAAAQGTGAGAPSGPATPPDIGGVTVVSLPQISDLRGSISFAEVGKQLPFVVQRYFVLYDIPTPEIRGEHAHRQLHQFLVPLRGSCHIAADDGTRRWETLLNSPRHGLHVAPLVWLTLFGFSADCILLVLASDVYRESDYIRSYDEFAALAAARSKS